MTSPPRIVVADDDPAIRRTMQRVLQLDGYEVLLAPDGNAALDLLRQEPADLLVLDLMMPGRDGFEVCHLVREQSHVPILVLTARDAPEDKVAVLDRGADDYVVKPFNPDELLARVRALLRRAQPREQDPDALQFHDVHMTPSTREAYRGGELLDLTPREYDLLETFLRHPRRVLSREEILQRVWGYDYLGESNLVDVRIKYLRDKLEAGGRPRIIQTIRGAGYALRV